jgi:hypothetical protein
VSDPPPSNVATSALQLMFLVKLLQEHGERQSHVHQVADAAWNRMAGTQLIRSSSWLTHGDPLLRIQRRGHAKEAWFSVVGLAP